MKYHIQLLICLPYVNNLPRKYGMIKVLRYIMVTCCILMQQISCNPVTISTNGPRLLIVTTRAGGHWQVAEAIAKKLRNYFAIDMLDLGKNSILRLVDYTYGEALRLNLNGFRTMIGAGAAKVACNKSSALLMWKLGGPKVNIGQYEYIINLYSAGSFVLNDTDRLHIPVIQIVTDMGNMGTWPSHSNIIHVLGSDKLWEQFDRCPHRLAVSGMVLRPEFENIRSSSKVDMKAKLGLSLDKPVVLVSFGTFGAGQILQVASMVNRIPDKQFVFICGRSEELYQALLQFKNDRVRILGYTENMHEYMRAADVFIGKPGNISVAEAIQCETPMILKDAWDVMPQEKYALNIVAQKQYGSIIKDYNQLPKAIQQILSGKRDCPANNALNEFVHFMVTYRKLYRRMQSRIYTEKHTVTMR